MPAAGEHHPAFEEYCECIFELAEDDVDIIQARIADRLQVNSDPLLMVVAVGASCAFLTPIGHQNNVLVMGPGGYRFSDYWRMGLPLEVLIVAVSLLLLPVVWPF